MKLALNVQNRTQKYKKKKRKKNPRQQSTKQSPRQFSTVHCPDPPIHHIKLSCHLIHRHLVNNSHSLSQCLYDLTYLTHFHFLTKIKIKFLLLLRPIKWTHLFFPHRNLSHLRRLLLLLLLLPLPSPHPSPTLALLLSTTTTLHTLR